MKNKNISTYKTKGIINDNKIVNLSEKLTFPNRFAANVINNKLKTTIADVKIISDETTLETVFLGFLKNFIRQNIGYNANKIIILAVIGKFNFNNSP